MGCSPLGKTRGSILGSEEYCSRNSLNVQANLGPLLTDKTM